MDAKTIMTWQHRVKINGTWEGDAMKLEIDDLRAALQSQAEPMTDPCKTCSHFQEGKLPGVRIHDETCYECRSYWGNKWEAKSE